MNQLPGIARFAARTRRAEVPDTEGHGDANLLNMWHKFFVRRERPDLARAIVAAGEMTPALHAEWLALAHADTRRNTHLSNITSY